MEWDYIAPMLVSLTLILTLGGVILFRPLVKRLGDLIEIMAQNRRLEIPRDEVAGLREVIDALDARVALLEERQDFAESLLRSPRARPGSERLGTEVREALPTR